MLENSSNDEFFFELQKCFLAKMFLEGHSKDLAVKSVYFENYWCQMLFQLRWKEASGKGILLIDDKVWDKLVRKPFSF